jgi:hypothetical protein
LSHSFGRSEVARFDVAVNVVIKRTLWSRTWQNRAIFCRRA